ncbi:hypothetical protein FQA39_LY09109 [Lamprigera yunnana]|nr:hypothetical protein FQA39_LY09109 [Lamprigera yunnana]
MEGQDKNQILQEEEVEEQTEIEKKNDNCKEDKIMQMLIQLMQRNSAHKTALVNKMEENNQKLEERNSALVNKLKETMLNKLEEKNCAMLSKLEETNHKLDETRAKIRTAMDQSMEKIQKLFNTMQEKIDGKRIIRNAVFLSYIKCEAGRTEQEMDKMKKFVGYFVGGNLVDKVLKDIVGNEMNIINVYVGGDVRK